ncbi:hypothetical protein LJB75_00135 [Bacteroidales bacterium OttesenSCG-928-L19]|nr:hypothetical protein [Bacteroidales bacterium OttesenSCG-928-L19]
MSTLSYSYDIGELGSWQSVDPLASKYPSLSPYVYCANNPVILVDPDGRDFGEPDRPFGRPDYEQRHQQTNETKTTTETSSSSKSSSKNVSHTTTSKTERSIPENRLVTASVYRSETKGESNTLNVNTTTTASTSKGTANASSSVEAQLNTELVKLSAGVETSSNGSTSMKGTLSLGPLDIGLSQTNSPDIINSSFSFSFGVTTGSSSRGFSIGIKPVGVLTTGAILLVPVIAPVVVPTSVVTPPLLPNTNMQ